MILIILIQYYVMILIIIVIRYINNTNRQPTTSAPVNWSTGQLVNRQINPSKTLVRLGPQCHGQWVLGTNRTMNPPPQTMNPPPQTMNPPPQTMNPPPQTMNPPPQTMNPPIKDACQIGPQCRGPWVLGTNRTLRCVKLCSLVVNYTAQWWITQPSGELHSPVVNLICVKLCSPVVNYTAQWWITQPSGES
jgi:hypothetical protein